VGNVLTVLYEQKRYPEAEPMAREVLEGRKRRLGPDNPDTLDSMNDLAGLLLHLGQLDEAEKMLPETLAGMRKAHGPTHPDVATTLTLFSWLALQRSDKDRALAFLREALDHGLAGTEAIKAVEDPLFQPLIGDPRFQALAAEAKSKMTK